MSLTDSFSFLNLLGFQYHMQKFTTFIVDLMKQEKFFASQGGPIILAQASIFDFESASRSFFFPNHLVIVNQLSWFCEITQHQYFISVYLSSLREKNSGENISMPESYITLENALEMSKGGGKKYIFHEPCSLLLKWVL